MLPRPLGTTGRCVTPIGLGMAALGRPGYLNVGHSRDLPADRSVSALRAHAHRVLHHAADRGVGYLDVARSYGRGEEFLGSWLAESHARARSVTVGSKWGYTYTAGWQVDVGDGAHEVKDHSVATFARQIVETNQHLGGHLDLYQIHSATLGTGVLDDAEVAAALRELAADGVAIGLSLSGSDQAATLDRAMAVAATGAIPFTSVQATWNVLEPSAGAALSAARDAGWGVIVKEAVANGRLTPRGDAPATVRHLARAHDVEVDAIAMAAALAQPFTSVVLSGAATVEHLDSNLRAVEVELSTDDLAALAACAEPPAAYWSRRSDLPWT